MAGFIRHWKYWVGRIEVLLILISHAPKSKTARKLWRRAKDATFSAKNLPNEYKPQQCKLFSPFGGTYCVLRKTAALQKENFDLWKRGWILYTQLKVWLKQGWSWDEALFQKGSGRDNVILPKHVRVNTNCSSLQLNLKYKFHIRECL